MNLNKFYCYIMCLLNPPILKKKLSLKISTIPALQSLKKSKTFIKCSLVRTVT